MFDSLVAAMSGNKMTDEQAALCVQAYWRRYLSVIYYQESRGAAITVQVATASREYKRAQGATWPKGQEGRGAGEPGNRGAALWEVEPPEEWVSWARRKPPTALPAAPHAAAPRCTPRRTPRRRRAAPPRG